MYKSSCSFLKYALCAFLFLLLAFQPWANAAGKDATIYRNFFEATGARQHYQQMKNMLLRKSRQDFIVGLEKTLPLQQKITQDQQKQIMPLVKSAFDSYIKKLQAELDRIMPYETVVSEIYTPAFAKHFNTAEIKQITAFYSSPTGKKFIANLPKLMQGSFETVQKRYAAQLKNAQDKLAKKELKKLKLKVDQTLGITADKAKPKKSGK